MNDCFKPVSRYWDRINRPEQLITALPEALRVLTSPAETGAVTLCLPQDVQAEAFDYPEALFRKRVWTIARPRPDPRCWSRPRRCCRSAKAPLIVAGGGVIYSEATDGARALRRRDRHRGGRDHGGQGRAARSTIRRRSARSASPGAPGANRLRARGRSRHRRRLAAERLHDRVEDRLPAPGRPVHQRQRHRVRRRQAPGAAARRRREGGARGMAAADGRLADIRRLSRARRRARRPPGSRKSIASIAARPDAGRQPGRGDWPPRTSSRGRATSS